MRIFISFCCVAALLCMSLPALAMSLEDFQSRCTMGLQFDNNEICTSKQDICGAYMEAISQTKDKATCKKACQDSEAAQRPDHIVDQCEQVVQHGYDECTIYCESLQ